MSEFTREERNIIDGVYRKLENGETITPDEAVLYAKFEAFKAIRSDEQAEKRKALQEQRDVSIANAHEIADIAKANLAELHDIAMNNYSSSLRLVDGE